MGRGYRKKRDFPDHIPTLFGRNLTLSKRLGGITVVDENWEDSVLAAAGMSAAWLSRGKMAQLFFVRCVGVQTNQATRELLEIGLLKARLEIDFNRARAELELNIKLVY